MRLWPLMVTETETYTCTPSHGYGSLYTGIWLWSRGALVVLGRDPTPTAAERQSSSAQPEPCVNEDRVIATNIHNRIDKIPCYKP